MRSAFFVALVMIGCGPGARETVDGSAGLDGNFVIDGDDLNISCSESAKLVYVVDANQTLSQFDPQTKTFTSLGQLICPAQSGATPFSMGVSRRGIAWVLYTSGELFRVDRSNNLACTKSAWQPGTGGHKVFGMGFSTDAPGGTTDTLFIAGADQASADSSLLAKLDLTQFAPMSVGSVAGLPELTGTGNAELWGLFPKTTGTTVQKLDKMTGSAVQTFELPELDGPVTAWAFAFFGGDFWIFVANGQSPASTVYQVDGMTGEIEGTTSTALLVVGAGVSTCAPVIL